jgi:hypothetical protein
MKPRKAVFLLKLRGIVKFLIFCWAAVIIVGMNSNSKAIIREVYVETKTFITETQSIIRNNILTYYLAQWELKLPDLQIGYNVQPAFASPIAGCISSLTSIFLRYLGNTPARAPPEPRGPL